MFNLLCNQGMGRDALKLCVELKSVRTKGSGSSSNRCRMSVLLPNAVAPLLPSKHAWELNQETQATQTPYAITGEMRSPFKPNELLFGGI